jgi:hypothetical protein
MGRAYAILTSLCYSGDAYEEEGRRLFVEVLERLNELDPSRPRFDAACRLLWDADAPWAVNPFFLNFFLKKANAFNFSGAVAWREQSLEHSWGLY